MAIVLPQGRFNNISDGYLRRFIGLHARILAVVGLHVNTFKPHTGTKTSILFLQKWNEDAALGPLCPRSDDYPIFFATSERSGKDNSGEYIYLKDREGQDLLDLFGHQIVDQDLFDVRLVVENQLGRLKERDHADADKIKAHEERYADILMHLPVRSTIAEAFTRFATNHDFSFWPGA